MNLIIESLSESRIPEIANAFKALGWNKPASQYYAYLQEQNTGIREVLVAFVDSEFAGYVTVVWRSLHPAFATLGIPEIVDFNVLPHLRRRGIGSRLMETAENLVSTRSKVVGIGVGLDSDYGSAQRMYVKRGYIPDGNGISSDGKPLKWGDKVTLDDSLALHFTKQLR